MQERFLHLDAVWEPHASRIPVSRIQRYVKWLRRHYQLSFESYHELHQWSIENTGLFWQTIAEYFKVRFNTPYQNVMSDAPMPHTEWFEGGTLNYVEHIFLGATDYTPALKYLTESTPLKEMSWDELRKKVATIAEFLKKQGIQKGDCVVAFVANTPETLIAFLATASLGAVWSSCSPDFGAASVVERFQQIKPKLMFATEGYEYGGKFFDKIESIAEIATSLKMMPKIVLISSVNDSFSVDYAPLKSKIFKKNPFFKWVDLIENSTDSVLTFESVPFSHPLYVLYSSGTTGNPKAITHCHGGILVEHLKYLGFHNNLNAGETYFWYSTTGWMMWNLSISALLHGATLLLYDGSPSFPHIGRLWELGEEGKIHHLGVSAAYILACRKAEYELPPHVKLHTLVSVGSTGSTLPYEGYFYVYKKIKPDVWLTSMAGGTDICTAWLGGNPNFPVYAGEIQCICLGCDMQSFNEKGEAVKGVLGELVACKPMPSMPIYFWDDKNFLRYKQSYFDTYPNVWRHGDWVKFYPEPNRGCYILGRSDATLNRNGIRVGSAEIYRVVEKVMGVKDSLVINIELPDGQHFMPLFIVFDDSEQRVEGMRTTIKKAIRDTYTSRYLPDDIIAVPDIPYTISGKKMETPVKKVLMGVSLKEAVNEGAMRNPEAMTFFVKLGRKKVKKGWI
ncbi:MAG: acetoacetate--CoA ligase [Saprospiraceae bacterium]|nr:acetoacetate--CoA ligase [Saprospiraceae bacterium]